MECARVGGDGSMVRGEKTITINYNRIDCRENPQMVIVQSLVKTYRFNGWDDSGYIKLWAATMLDCRLWLCSHGQLGHFDTMVDVVIRIQ